MCRHIHWEALQMLGSFRLLRFVRQLFLIGAKDPFFEAAYQVVTLIDVMWLARLSRESI